VDEEYLLKPRKWNIDNVKKFMIYVGPISSIFDYATFGLMWFVYHCSTHAAEHDHPEKLFQTAWFVESLLTQTLIVHIIRTNKIPFIQSSASWPLFHEHDGHHGHWVVAALFAAGAFPGICAAAGIVVVLDGIVFAFVLGSLPSCEGLVPEEIRD
jgi:magnesium-transporting ATPase (P-type)